MTRMLLCSGRHCERSEAIQPFKRPLKICLDCHVASRLAMTAFLVPARPAKVDTKFVSEYPLWRKLLKLQYWHRHAHHDAILLAGKRQLSDSSQNIVGCVLRTITIWCVERTLQNRCSFQRKFEGRLKA